MRKRRRIQEEEAAAIADRVGTLCSAAWAPDSRKVRRSRVDPRLVPDRRFMAALADGKLCVLHVHEPNYRALLTESAAWSVVRQIARGLGVAGSDEGIGGAARLLRDLAHEQLAIAPSDPLDRSWPTSTRCPDPETIRALARQEEQRLVSAARARDLRAALVAEKRTTAKSRVGHYVDEPWREQD